MRTAGPSLRVVRLLSVAYVGERRHPDLGEEINSAMVGGTRRMNGNQRRSDLIAAYKELLRVYLEKRPSGLRRKISEVIGTNRSFVSQITNPKYSVPIPSHYVHRIISVCHFSPAERVAFISAYLGAHPRRAELVEGAGADSLTIDLSAVADESQRYLIRRTLRETADSLIALASGKERGEE